MNSIEILIKCITLLYRESQLNGSSRETGSKDLVTHTLSKVAAPDKLTGTLDNARVLEALRNIVTDMCSDDNQDDYDSINILQAVKLSCSDDKTPYEALEAGIGKDIPDSKAKTLVINLKRNLNNFFKEQEISSLLRKANFEFNHKRYTIKSTNDFINKITTQLESLELQRSMKDPAVTTELDVGDTTTLVGILKEVKDNENEDGILKTGWKLFNKMLQGGLRRGEFIVMPALQHKYKTGFSLSIFCQIALFNKPYLLDVKKKPLLIRISFEDDITNNMQFVYSYLKYCETGEKVCTKDIADTEMASYIKEKLGVNGYHIKLLRVNPSEWSYKHITNKILSLEAEGYEVHLLMLDYLSMIPTIGCNTSGPTGTDIRDLFRRIRNFCSVRKITVMTPHQISPSGKNLLRSGIPNESFVKEVEGKGHYSGCSQLDQEVDVETYIHLAYIKKKWYLTVQRGKHRIPTQVDEKYKYLLLPFDSKDCPIRHDLDTDTTIGFNSIDDLNKASNNSDNVDFDF